MAKKAKAEASKPVEKTAATSTAKPKNSQAVLRAPIGAFVAEMIGTFMLTAVVIATRAEPVVVMFALIAIVLVIGHLSGAHLNPAITFGAWITRQVSGIRAIGYVIAQFVGAMLAVVSLSALLGGVPEQMGMTGQPQPAELFTASPLVEGKEWYAFFAELLGATLFGFAVAAAFKHKEQMAAAFTVGGGLFIGLLVGGVGIVVLNPAIALAIEALTFENMMPTVVYAIATLIGGGLGFLFYKLIRTETDKEQAKA